MAMAGNARFRVWLSKTYTNEVTLHYATQDMTALAGVNYTSTSGDLVFAPGETEKFVLVPYNTPAEDAGDLRFRLVISDPVNTTIIDSSGVAVINEASQGKYYDWFVEIYDLLMDTSNGYFGPPTGPKAFKYVYHARERLLVEAPDDGHQSVSETASFWGKLAAMNIAMRGDASDFIAMWQSVDTLYVPNAVHQPWGTYNTASPADYQPEMDTPDQYPVLPTSFPSGAGTSSGDVLANALETTYGTKAMYLMHWMHDTDGAYGYHNRDGSTTGVYINSFQRGMQESTWETIVHPEIEDWAQQGVGGNAAGYLPLYAQGTPDYPAAPYAYSQQMRYTCAPDAEARLISATVLANKFAQEQSLSITAQVNLARKMGDYLRYSLRDKYFHKGAGIDGNGFAALISWYVSFGMQYVTSGTPAWGFRISSSNFHQGYQAPDVAYYLATGGGGYAPSTSGAGAEWATALDRQLELMRWLQTAQGPIYGGVTNSWKGRYETPTDGRQINRFYGMYATYAPEWHDPPSNNWVGFQAWSMERVASLYHDVATKTGTLNVSTRTRCAVLLHRWLNWMLDEITFDDDGVAILPGTLEWTSPTQVVGETTTVPNNEGVYEWVANLNWDSTGDYAAFWNASTVPNPNFKCTVSGPSTDLGVAACTAQILIQFADAHRKIAGNSLANTIPGGAHTVQECVDVAAAILDGIRANHFGTFGYTIPEPRTDYIRYADIVPVPSIYHGVMPNGDVIEEGVRFIDIRSFMMEWEGWDSVQAYIDGGDVPVFSYHRFWHNAEIGTAFAMMHKYLGDVVYS
jgi:hypothetical protein